MSVCYRYKNVLKFLILFIPIFYLLECVYSVGSEDVRKASGYLGEQVVLMLDVDPTWDLTVIEWSVYENSTYIATFQEGHLIIFRDRIELNNITGDLRIKNLRPEDALQYKVYLQNMKGNDQTIYFQLSLKEQVSKPNITLLEQSLDAKKCNISLKCTTMSNTVTLSWTLDRPLDINERFSESSINSRESVISTSLVTNRDVNFTCTATDEHHNVSSKWHAKCPDHVQQNSTVITSCGCPARGIGGLILGLIVGVFVGCIGVIIYFQQNGSHLAQPTTNEEDGREDENAEDKQVEDQNSDQSHDK